MADETALFIASKEGRADVVKALLQFQAKVNAAEFRNKIPLHAAAVNGAEEVVRLLIVTPTADDNRQLATVYD